MLLLALGCGSLVEDLGIDQRNLLDVVVEAVVPLNDCGCVSNTSTFGLSIHAAFVVIVLHASRFTLKLMPI